MAGKLSKRTGVRTTTLGDNPLEGEQLLLDALYGRVKPEPPAPPLVQPAMPVVEDAPPKPKPEHYKVVSISLYREDIERLEQMVLELKRRGHHKANKSQLIRQALAMVDLEKVAKEA